MSNIGALDMALDEVISQNRKQHRKLKQTSNNNKGGSRRTGGGSITKNTRAPAKRSSPYSRPVRAPLTTNKAAGNSLTVGNLHFNVTEKDLYDLFGQIGPVRKAFLHIGPTGKSAGIADIVFKNNNDAARARTTYNNVELDGRPMRITTTAAVSAAVSSIQSKQNNSGRRNNNVRPSNNNSRAGNRRGGRRENRPKPNEQDLDADMDSYMGSAE